MSVHRLSTAPESKFGETIAQRMERLRLEALGLAQDHTADFQSAIGVALGLADEIAVGGEAYPVGVRETARRVALELQAAGLTLEALRQRAAG